jgi:urocanate hydratase
MSELKKAGGEKAVPLPRRTQTARAARGTQLSCAGWTQEAALRMLMNSLDEEIAERPRELIACGATGKVLRDWDSYHVTVESLKKLKDDETLLVQSGKPAGVFETHQAAPRVLIVDSIQTDHSPAPGARDQLEDRDRTISGCNIAASWTQVGTQGELPTAFQTLDDVAEKHFDGSLVGKLIVSGGLGAAGGALPLAAALLGAAFLGIEADEEKIKRRIRSGYCDYCVNSMDEALRILKNAVRQKHAVSVGLIGNCADVIPELAGRGVVPDVLTDQTGAHDVLNGYIPSGLGAEAANRLRGENPAEFLNLVRHSFEQHFCGMLALQKLGSVVFEFGNGIQTAAQEFGIERASKFPYFAEAYLRPLSSAGMTPVRWIALSGDTADIHRLDDLALGLFPNDAVSARWIPLARKFVRFQGLPARVCWLGSESRIVLAGHVNRLVAEGAFKAPIVIAFDQVENDQGGLRQPEPERMKNKADAILNQHVLKALLDAASGASWASLKCGKGHCQATVVLVADGTPKASQVLPRVLKNDFAARLARMAVADLQTP